MAALTALVVVIGGAVGGKSGLIIGLGIALAMNFFSYWFSDKAVIAMTRSKAVSESEAPELYAMLRRLTMVAQIPMPKIYVTPSEQPNAFATGRNPSHAAVAVTQGLMKLLTPDQLEGVLAHELAHIKNRDILIGSMAAVMAGAITMIAQFAFFFSGSSDSRDRGLPGLAIMLVAIILAPIAAALIQMAISRSREYLADSTGAKFAGRPDGLAGALQSLERGAQRIPMEVNSAAAHMFIVNPLSGQRMARLFSTHPSTEDRVSKLRSLGPADFVR